MIHNTVNDFLKTVDATSKGMTSMTCPACGSQMGLQQSGSYQNILTPKARDVINSSLSIYSRFLEDRDRQLEQLNIFGINPLQSNTDYPYKREDEDRPNLKTGGVFEGTEGKQELYEFVKKYLDYFDSIENMKDFPRIEESEKKHIRLLKKLLLTGAEPRRLSGPLVDLIFDQPDVAKWMKKHATSEAIDQLLDEICPSYQKYLVALRGLISSEDSPSQKSDLEGLKRVQFILAILLGHKSSDNNLKTLEGLNMESQVPFLLPRITEVSPKTLFNLLRSDVILNNPEFAWEQSIVTKIRDRNLPDNLENFTINLNNLILKFGPEIKKFIHFACTGPLNSEENKGEQGGNNLICGWYPKEEETHTIILLGSAGTGKSTMMMTGLTAFYEYAAGMGAKIIFESPSDEEIMKNLRKQYFDGKLPKANKKGFTQNIMLSLEFPRQDANKKKLYFVFTDIAGQTIARCLTEKGADSSVKRILKNAETIVAFFDLSIESAFRQAFTQGDDENIWKDVKENYERVRQSRQEDAEISQIQLFNRLLADLQEERDNGLRETKFLCVIPKADLFVREGDERFFLTPFFEEMRDKAMFVPSRQNKSGEGFDGYYSIGGIGSNVSQKEGLARQNELGIFISQVAQNCLKNIGKALGNEPDFQPLADSLYYKLKTNLFDNLSEIFSDENVYYLPVSAQGKNVQKDPDEEGYVKLEHPPNQKLAEYVFMLPIAWSAQPSNPQKDSEPERPNSPQDTVNTDYRW